MELSRNTNRAHVTVERKDRLSELPKDLQIKIVSMLPIQDTVRTSLLSRKWRDSYRSVSNLIFIYHQFPEVEGKSDCFVKFVDQMLSSHDMLNIETFVLEFWQNNVPFKDEWVAFAVNHKVQHLCLSVKMEDSQRLPCSLFSLKSLTILELCVFNYVLRLPKSICLPNLKKLLLMYVKFMDDELTENLFSSCSSLETLYLTRCGLSHLKVLSVSALKLKCFVLERCMGISQCVMKLETPNLQQFSYDDDIAKDYDFGDTPSIHEALVCFQNPFPTERSSDDLSFCAVKLLKGVCRATYLLLNEYFIEVLFSKANYLLMCMSSTSFGNVECAQLHIWPTKEHIQKMLALLCKFSNISDLCIVNIGPGLPFLSSFEGVPEDLDVDGILNHLKVVFLEGIEGYDAELDLVKFLSENTQALSDMKITVRCEHAQQKIVETLQTSQSALERTVVEIGVSYFW